MHFACRNQHARSHKPKINKWSALSLIIWKRKTIAICMTTNENVVKFSINNTEDALEKTVRIHMACKKNYVHMEIASMVLHTNHSIICSYCLS
jgi:hypothetical protein